MSEQNASVERAYAIAAHFSERARRVAAEQHYEVTYGSPIRPIAYPAPRARVDGRKYCPLGIMAKVDGIASGGASPSPTPDSIAIDLLYKGRADTTQYIHSGSPEYDRWIELRSQAANFTGDWDTCKLQPKDLAAALGLVPPSADATDDD